FSRASPALRHATNWCRRPRRVLNRRANPPAAFSQSIRNRRWRNSFVAPGFTAVFRHNAAQCVNVAVQIALEFVEPFPRIPLRADELAGDAVTLRTGQING